MKFNAMLLVPIAFIGMLIACDTTNSKNRHWETFITPAYLYDSLPPALLQQVNPVEIQGYKIQQALGATTYFFEYTANHNELLKQVAKLPFAVDSVRADIECRMVTGRTELKRIEALFDDPILARNFHQSDPLNNYDVYECLKFQHHFILLSKTSDRVIHIIHQS
jgi:hypothetical protein